MSIVARSVSPRPYESDGPHHRTWNLERGTQSSIPKTQNLKPSS